MKKFLLFSLLGFITLLSVSCSKESTPLTVSPEQITCYTDMTVQIEATPSEGATYAVADDFYAKVDDTGLVTARKVGKTEIHVSSPNGAKTIPCTVIPKYTLCDDMTQYVGTSISSVISKFGTNYTSKTGTDGVTTYTYQNYNSYLTGLGFSVKNGIVDNVLLAISTKYTSQFTDYLTERYSVVGMQNDIFFFLDHDKKVIIAFTVYSYNMLTVMYYPYSASD